MRGTLAHVAHGRLVPKIKEAKVARPVCQSRHGEAERDRATGALSAVYQVIYGS